MHRLALIAALIVAWQSLVLAQETEPQRVFEHAGFVDGKRSMKNLVDFPRTNSDVEVAVICTSHATAKGRLRDAYCSAANDPELEFTMAVSRRFNAARLHPAMVNGKAEEVDFQFTVLFARKGDEESVSVYPHNMKNVDRLGLDYVGAQRYSFHPFPEDCDFKTTNDLVLEVAVVDAAGKAKEINVTSAKFPMTPICKSGFERYLRNGEWIPAMHNGHHVDAVWTQPRIAVAGSFKRQRNPFKE